MAGTMRPPLPKERLFLGGVVDAIGDAGEWVGDQVGSGATWLGDQAKSFYNSPVGQTLATGAGAATLGPVGAILANNKLRGETRDWISENPELAGKIGGGLAAGVATVATGGAAAPAIMPAIQTGGQVGDALGTTPQEARRQRAIAKRRRQQALGAPLPDISMGSATQGGRGQTIAYGGYVENELAYGGKMKMMGQDAKKIKGPKHEQGGVHLDQNTEVEGGETMDNVNGNDYVFSDRLTVPKEVLPDGKQGMTFADYHEYLVENNASRSTIQELAEIQEREAGRDNNSVGNREQQEPNKRMKHLGPLGKRLNRLAGQRASGGYISNKVSKLVDEGYDQDQAVAIAHDMQDDKATGGEVEYQDGGFMDSIMSNVPDRISGPNTSGFEYYTGQGMGDAGGSGFWSQAGDLAEGALPYLPAIMNVGRGLLEDSEVPDVPYTPPSGRAEDTIRRMETDVDVSDQLASVDRSLRSIIADPRASMNQKRAAASTAAQQRAKIEGQEERQETSLQNEMMSRLASAQQRRDMAISRGRTEAARQERRQQMKADEAQMNLIQTGLQQAGQRFQQQQRWEDKLEMDAMSLASELAAVPNDTIRNHVLDMLAERFPGKATRVQELMNNQ